MVESQKFSDFSISEDLLKAVADMGFEEATPIQKMAIPAILEGNDITGQAQTGTGKTAAFGIPLIEMIDSGSRDVQVLVLAPTRELAIQIAEEFSRFGKFKKGLSIVPVYGGQPIERQFRALRAGAQIVIGTPGRIMDHLERKTLSLDKVRFAVLDEADQMLDMGFRDDIARILKMTPGKRQTLLFSATMPPAILDLSKRYQKDPKFIKVVHGEMTVPQIEQCYLEVKEREKLDVLCKLVDIYNPDLAMVFCNTKRAVDDVTSRLQARGYFADALHGDMKQTQRDRVMAKFRKGSIDILVATDVAARGLDISEIDCVFNYDVPQDVEYYIHRIGRTARAGRAGTSISFVAPKEIYKLREIQRFAKVKITRIPIPSTSDVEESQARLLIEKVKEVNATGLGERFIPYVEQALEEGITCIEIATALMKIHLGGRDTETRSYENEGGSIEPGMARIRISIGRNNQIRAKDIVGAIAGETGLPGRSIGAIEIFEHFSYVDVPADRIHEIIEIMKDRTIRGFTVEMTKVENK